MGKKQNELLGTRRLITKFIKEKSRQYNCDPKEIQLSLFQFGVDFYIEVWHYKETGIEKADQWQILETKKVI